LAFPLLTFVGVITKSIEHSTESRDTIIAAGLAQEGVELVKNVRDNNWAQKNEAFDRLNSDSECKINYDYDMNNPCDSGSAVNLYWKDGFYTHDSTGGGEATKFSRKITIDEAAGENGETRIVTSAVTWENGDFSHCSVANKCVYATITLTKWGGE